MNTDMIPIPENLARIRSRIAEAAMRVGRDPADVCLVAVTKTFPVALILEAWESGQRHFGENRPEEGAEKIPQVARCLATNEGVEGELTKPELNWIGALQPIWHMIGHVQSRKTDLVAAHFDLVHSVDRLKLARKLSRLAVDADREIPILLECNVSGEASKYGYAAAGWQQDADVRARLAPEIEAVVALPGLRVEGLMTVAPIAADPEAVRPVFASLRGLRDWLREMFPHGRFPGVRWEHLSMGMSDDFEVAVEEGATLVRIGRAIFGPRTW